MMPERKRIFSEDEQNELSRLRAELGRLTKELAQVVGNDSEKEEELRRRIESLARRMTEIDYPGWDGALD